MSLSGRVFAAVYDRMMSGSERTGMAELRERIVSQAHGRVLEIGAGTGLNLRHYPPDAELVLTEPEEPMVRRLRRRRDALGSDAAIVAASSDALPYPDHSFDAVVATLMLCTVPEPAATLAEVRRVLRPGAPLLFLEHVRASEPKLAHRQDRWDPVWRRIGHGCRCNRTTLASIEQAGFDVADLRHEQLPKAQAIVRPLIVGRALAPGSW